MTNEELILQRIEKLETQFAPMIKTAEELTELKNDLIPLSNHGVKLLIEELQQVESAFQLEDLFTLIKVILRNVPNFTYSIHQMDNIIEFARDVEPLMKIAVPKLIEYLDDLEQKGVIRIYKSMLEIRSKVAAAYDADDIDQIGDGFVTVLGLAKKLSDPQTVSFLEQMASLPANIDLENSKKVGAGGLIAAGFNGEVKEGLGVLIELTKAMGKLKSSGNGTAPETDTLTDGE